jgi:uncharacterized protein YjbI with pentapeptide repeats
LKVLGRRPKDRPPVRLNLSGVNLRGLDLRGARLSGDDFSGADFEEALLGRADLTGANLHLEGAILAIANLRWANLADVRNLTQEQVDM